MTKSVFEVTQSLLSEARAAITTSEANLVLLQTKNHEVLAGDKSAGAAILSALLQTSPEETYKSIRAVKSSYTSTLNRIEKSVLSYNSELNDLHTVACYLDGTGPEPTQLSPALKSAMLSLAVKSPEAMDVSKLLKSMVGEARTELKRVFGLHQTDKGNLVIDKSANGLSPISVLNHAHATVLYKSQKRIFSNPTDDYSIQRHSAAAGMMKRLRQVSEWRTAQKKQSLVSKSSKYEVK